MRRQHLAIACLVLIAACRDSNAPAPVDPVGVWSGTTSQGRAVAFTVTSQGITEATIAYRVVGAFCTADVEITIGGAPVAIVNNEFETEFGIGSAILTVAGKFNSSTAASGTLVVDDFNCDGTVTTNWSATK